MEISFLLSILVSIFSLALVLVGIPAQILKNYREKRSGQPLLTIFIALAFYAASIAFFWSTSAWFPLASFSVGIVMWGITLVQFFIYRKAK